MGIGCNTIRINYFRKSFYIKNQLPIFNIKNLKYNTNNLKNTKYSEKLISLVKSILVIESKRPNINTVIDVLKDISNNLKSQSSNKRLVIINKKSSSINNDLFLKKVTSNISYDKFITIKHELVNEIIIFLEKMKIYPFDNVKNIVEYLNVDSIFNDLIQNIIKSEKIEEVDVLRNIINNNLIIQSFILSVFKQPDDCNNIHIDEINLNLDLEQKACFKIKKLEESIIEIIGKNAFVVIKEEINKIIQYNKQYSTYSNQDLTPNSIQDPIYNLNIILNKENISNKKKEECFELLINLLIFLSDEENK